MFPNDIIYLSSWSNMYVITTLSILLVVSIYQYMYSLPQPSIQPLKNKMNSLIPIHTQASMLKVFIEVVTILHFLTSVQWL